MTSASSMHEAGHPKSVLWANPERWRREEGGRGVQDGGTHVYLRLIHVNVWQKPSQYCKAIIFQLKLISLKKKMWYDTLTERTFPTQGSNLGLPHYRWILLPSEPPVKSYRYTVDLKKKKKDSSPLLNKWNLSELMTLLASCMGLK